MLHIALVGIGDELVKLWRIINHKYCSIDKIFSAPTDNLEKVIQQAGITMPVDDYVDIHEAVKEKHFDYIVISDVIKIAGWKSRIAADIETAGFPPDRIIDMSFFQTMEFDSLYNVLRNYESGGGPNYQFFVTGVSHAYASTDIRCYSMPGVNLALTSQDLFTDYELAKVVMAAKRSNLRFAIIGVAPFSLHYDMSKSVNRYRTLAYYPIINSLHNFELNMGDFFKLFTSTYFDSFESFSTELKFPQRLLCNSQDKYMDINDYIEIRKRLRDWDDKSYPETVVENKEILRAYITDCVNNDVVPILVIFPITQWYNKFFSHLKMSELKNYLNDISNEFSVPFLDLSADNRFSVNDFFDVEHLNIRGAEKASRILNDFVLQLGVDSDCVNVL